MDAEEGELMDSSAEKTAAGDSPEEHDMFEYNPQPRPDTKGFTGPFRAAPQPVHYSDSDERPSESDTTDTDSDSGIPRKNQKRNPKPPVATPNNAEFSTMAAEFQQTRKKNNVWSSIIQEEVLSQEMIGIGVGKSRRKGGRDVEDYDYMLAHSLDNTDDDDEEEMADDGSSKDDKMEDDERPTGAKGFGQFRGRKRANWQRKAIKRRPQKADVPLTLQDLKVTADDTPDDIAMDIANKLFEPKSDLIKRVVDILGKQTAMKLYKDTKDIEDAGGIMVVNGSRRRTPGGTYLHLVKTNPDLCMDSVRKVFADEVREKEAFRRKNQAYRRRQKAIERVRHLPNDDPQNLPAPEDTLPHLPTREELFLSDVLETRKFVVPDSDGEIQSDEDNIVNKCEEAAVPSVETKRLNNTPENSQDGFSNEKKSQDEDFLEITFKDDLF